MLARWIALAFALMLAIGLLLTSAGLARGADWTVYPEPLPDTPAWRDWREHTSEVGVCVFADRNRDATGAPIGSLDVPMAWPVVRRGTRVCMQHEGVTLESLP